MDRILAIWMKLAARIRGLRVQLRLCLRMSVAAVLTYLLSQALHLPLPLWAVLTSVIVTQMSVGKSLKATVDYMEGTLGGAVYSGIVGALFPQAGGIAIPLMLAVAVAPLALLAATSSRFAAAPFTAVMVLLIPSMTHVSPVYSAFYRVVEVALGCVVAVCVSLLLLPEHAHNLVVQSAARMLKRMGRVLPELVAGLREKQDFTKIAHIQDSIGKAFIELNSTTAEAKRERVPYLYGEPDPQPLVDSLLRLRHDLVMIGRASVSRTPRRDNCRT
ncbi:MAG: FUSC family protein [Methylovirgula sp.]